MSFSIAVEIQTALVAFEGPFSLSLATYGSKYDSHYGSLCFCCSYFYWEHDWGRDTLVGLSFGEEDSHTFCITCSNGSMGDDMATTVKHLFLYEVGHKIDWIPYDDQILFIIYGMVCANLIHNVGEEIFGDLVFILPF